MAWLWSCMCREMCEECGDYVLALCGFGMYPCFCIAQRYVDRVSRVKTLTFRVKVRVWNKPPTFVLSCPSSLTLAEVKRVIHEEFVYRHVYAPPSDFEPHLQRVVFEHPDGTLADLDAREARLGPRSQPDLVELGIVEHGRLLVYIADTTVIVHREGMRLYTEMRIRCSRYEPLAVFRERVARATGIEVAEQRITGPRPGFDGPGSTMLKSLGIRNSARILLTQRKRRKRARPRAAAAEETKVGDGVPDI